MIRRLINSVIIYSSILLSMLTILVSANSSSTIVLLLVVESVLACLTMSIIAYVKNNNPIRLFVYLLLMINILILLVLAVNGHYKEIIYLVDIELVFVCISLYLYRHLVQCH